VGVYRFDPGSTTKAGFNVGGGVIYDVTPKVSVEGVYNFHTVNTSGSAARFSTLQGGVRIRVP
jgi:opacity protein-like surface antigen